MLVLSFLALGALWKRPVLERRAAGRPLPEGLDRALRSTALRVLLGLVSTALLALVFLAALLGEPSSAENISPTFVLVLFWVGVPALQVVLGNVWRVLNPWLAVADAVAWLWRALGRTWQPPLSYPERLGVWPAAVALLAFAAYELVYVEPASPRPLAPFGKRDDGRLVLRVPLSGLGGVDPRPGLLALIAVMLGSVGFDSLSSLAFWQDWNADLQRPYILEDPGTADLVAMGFGLASLLVCVAFVAGAYLAAIRAAEQMTNADRPLTADFLQSLVPIAFVYVVAHYFTLLVIQGQYAIPLASDPFGFGWDLFGTIDYAPNIAPFAPNTVWYVQVGALVAGHVAGLAVAHDRAVAALPERDALRSQYAMLGLMILYTVGGMWLLSQG